MRNEGLNWTDYWNATGLFFELISFIYLNILQYFYEQQNLFNDFGFMEQYIWYRVYLPIWFFSILNSCLFGSSMMLLFLIVFYCSLVPWLTELSRYFQIFGFFCVGVVLNQFGLIRNPQMSKFYQNGHSFLGMFSFILFFFLRVCISYKL